MTTQTPDPFDGLDTLPTLTTERLTLRAITETDAHGLFEIFSDNDVVRYWSRPAMTSIEEARMLVTEIQNYWRARTLFQWGVTELPGGDLVGTCTLYRWDKTHARAELGYALRRDRWGRGLASEAVAAVLDFAFDRMKLHRVGADTDPRNLASAKLLERLGFQREGTQRETFHHLGEWADSALWGLLATDSGSDPRSPSAS